MKDVKLNLYLIAIFISVGMAPSVITHYPDGVSMPKVIPIISAMSPLVMIETKQPEIINVNSIKSDSYTDFLNHIGFFESGNDYTKVNTIGYLGKYQFGKSTLKTLRYKGTIDAFLKSKKVQESIMLKNLKYNKRQLSTIINKYGGVVINDITITESGILAAAHLAGAGNVKRFFKHGKKSKDIYGTSVTKYLCEFSGYNLKLK